MSGVLHDPDGSAIDVIIYHQHGDRWVPHDVRAQGTSYDFDWCSRDACTYFHMSGYGPAAPVELSRYADAPEVCARIWMADGVDVRLVEYNEQFIAVELATSLREAGYERIAETPECPFLDAAERDTYWCDSCNDRLPDDCPCDHEQEAAS